MSVVREPTGEQTVSLQIDGREVKARPKELVIAAAERAGIYIPRFCYHPRMRPVGMCRMCLVEQETPRGPALVVSCMLEAADGMVIRTDTDVVKKAQDGVLEFLLINHPLDCPVCDKGGECPLQDQTLTFGPGESRFVEEKRHWEKPIELSALVHMDRERCILCDRCTRFSKEVAGDPLIQFIGRGAETQVNTFPDHPFASYFSGNTVQICPVGALLSRPYRFRARPWDLEQVESTCQMCAVGCRMAVQSSANQLVRHIGLDSDPVNHGWLCDKGRYTFEAVNSADRLSVPLVRKGDELVETSWSEAFAAAAAGLRRARGAGASAIGVIGGARLANEDAYAWAKLAKKVLGTDNVDAQLGDGLPAEVVLGLPRATIDEACEADAVVLLAPDLKQELPVLYLRLRAAAVDRGVPVVEVSPLATSMTEHARVSLRYRPGESGAVVRAITGGDVPDIPGVSREQVESARAALRGAQRVVVVLGRPSVAEPADSIAAAAHHLAESLPGVKFLSALRRGNVHGALDMGLAPGILPGRLSLARGRQWFADAWGGAPEEPGMDTTGMLRAAVDGSLRALVLLGADPIGDFPDSGLAERALAAVPFVVAVDCFETASVAHADVVLPAAMFGERPGTTTNLEGRITRLGQKITPPGVAYPDWMIAAELAAQLGEDLGFLSLEEIWDEIERLAPSHAGITRGVLADARYRDGVVAGRGADAIAQISEGDTVTAGASVTEAWADDAPDVTTDPTAAPARAAAESQGMVAVASDPSAAEEQQGEPAPEQDRPQPLQFSGVAAPQVPKQDSYSLRVVATRTLWDEGTMVQRSPSLGELAPRGTVRVNPHDLDRLGVASGGDVRVRGARGSSTFCAEADRNVPRGSVVLCFNVPGADAASVIDANSTVTDVRLETP